MGFVHIEISQIFKNIYLNFQKILNGFFHTAQSVTMTYLPIRQAKALATWEANHFFNLQNHVCLRYPYVNHQQTLYLFESLTLFFISHLLYIE